MFHAAFRSLQSRNPLARLIAGVLGAIAVLLLITLGMFALAAIAVGGFAWVLINALRSATKSTPAPQASPTPPGVIEGEFKVVSPATRMPERAQPR